LRWVSGDLVVWIGRKVLLGGQASVVVWEGGYCEELNTILSMMTGSGKEEEREGIMYYRKQRLRGLANTAAV
jgi:uncharacterized protein (DUF39 family)